MSTKQEKVPVVIYELPKRIEACRIEREKRQKAKKAFAAAVKNQEAILSKQKEESQKLAAAKKALREEIRRTHVIPYFVMEEKRARKEEQKKAREFAFVEYHRQKKLEEDILKEQKERAFRMKQFKKQVRSAKVVPLDVHYLPTAFEESEIGKEYILECGDLVDIMFKLMRTIGFSVEIGIETSETSLCLRKTYPYWREAYSDKKKMS